MLNLESYFVINVNLSIVFMNQIAKSLAGTLHNVISLKPRNQLHGILTSINIDTILFNKSV